MDDLISRQALCEYALNQNDKSVTPNDIMRFPSAQSEPCKDTISRQDAIDYCYALINAENPSDPSDEWNYSQERINQTEVILHYLEVMPSAQPERTEYIPDTKAVPSKRDCVDLAERVTATFYDQEHEEWTQKSVTIADVLDSVCDEYTIFPSAQPETHEERTETHACDLIDRQAAIDEIKVLYEWHDTVTEDRTIDHLKRLPSAQPFHNITMDDVLKYIDRMPEDVWQEFTACLECRGWELQRRTAKWCGSEFA